MIILFFIVAVPEAPKYIHVKVEDSLLKLHWRRVENNGRPILKYNVRVSDLTGRVLLEKVSYKPFILFRNVVTSNGLSVQVNAMTAAGLSEWSQPYVYSPSTPSVMIQSVSAYDALAVVHLNVTVPGSLLCSYYGSNVRPAFVNRKVHHAGHARMMLENLTPMTDYTVECSLHVDSITTQSNKQSFTTPAHQSSHLEVTDVEPYSTFARISVRSDMPGVVRCMPMRKHFGRSSLRSFKRMAEQFFVRERRRNHD